MPAKVRCPEFRVKPPAAGRKPHASSHRECILHARRPPVPLSGA